MNVFGNYIVSDGRRRMEMKDKAEVLYFLRKELDIKRFNHSGWEIRRMNHIAENRWSIGSDMHFRTSKDFMDVLNADEEIALHAKSKATGAVRMFRIVGQNKRKTHIQNTIELFNNGDRK